MRFSNLQKYILVQSYFAKNKTKFKIDFYDFYSTQELKENYKNIQDVVHKSLESLVKKDFLVAFGKKTAHKWFIEKVSLTAKGRQMAKEIAFKRQRKLPIK